jgi:hypothetical protein
MIDQPTSNPMDGESRNRVFRISIAVPLFVALFLSRMTQFIDPDVFLHLKIGEWIWLYGRIPTVDPFSFTRFGQPWVAHEWLFELIMYLTHRIGGVMGLAIVRSLATALAPFLL